MQRATEVLREHLSSLLGAHAEDFLQACARAHASLAGGVCVSALREGAIWPDSDLDLWVASEDQATLLDFLHALPTPVCTLVSVSAAPASIAAEVKEEEEEGSDEEEEDDGDSDNESSATSTPEAEAETRVARSYGFSAPAGGRMASTLREAHTFRLAAGVTLQVLTLLPPQLAAHAHERFDLTCTQLCAGFPTLALGGTPLGLRDAAAGEAHWGAAALEELRGMGGGAVADWCRTAQRGCKYAARGYTVHWHEWLSAFEEWGCAREGALGWGRHFWRAHLPRAWHAADALARTLRECLAEGVVADGNGSAPEAATAAARVSLHVACRFSPQHAAAILARCCPQRGGAWLQAALAMACASAPAHGTGLTMLGLVGGSGGGSGGGGGSDGAAGDIASSTLFLLERALHVRGGSAALCGALYHALPQPPLFLRVPHRPALGAFPCGDATELLQAAGGQQGPAQVEAVLAAVLRLEDCDAKWELAVQVVRDMRCCSRAGAVGGGAAAAKAGAGLKAAELALYRRAVQQAVGVAPWRCVSALLEATGLGPGGAHFDSSSHPAFLVSSASTLCTIEGLSAAGLLAPCEELRIVLGACETRVDRVHEAQALAVLHGAPSFFSRHSVMEMDLHWAEGPLPLLDYAPCTAALIAAAAAEIPLTPCRHPLHFAAQRGSEALVHALLAVAPAGAALEINDESPFFSALAFSNVDAARALISATPHAVQERALARILSGGLVRSAACLQFIVGALGFASPLWPSPTHRAINWGKTSGEDMELLRILTPSLATGEKDVMGELLRTCIRARVDVELLECILSLCPGAASSAVEGPAGTNTSALQCLLALSDPAPSGYVPLALTVLQAFPAAAGEPVVRATLPKMVHPLLAAMGLVRSRANGRDPAYALIEELAALTPPQDISGAMLRLALEAAPFAVEHLLRLNPSLAALPNLPSLAPAKPCTPWEFACRDEYLHPASFFPLLRAMPWEDPFAPNSPTPLHLLAQSISPHALAIVRTLLSESPSRGVLLNSKGLTPLLCALDHTHGRLALDILALCPAAAAICKHGVSAGVAPLHFALQARAPPHVVAAIADAAPEVVKTGEVLQACFNFHKCPPTYAAVILPVLLKHLDALQFCEKDWWQFSCSGQGAAELSAALPFAQAVCRASSERVAVSYTRMLLLEAVYFCLPEGVIADLLDALPPAPAAASRACACRDARPFDSKPPPCTTCDLPGSKEAESVIEGMLERYSMPSWRAVYSPELVCRIIDAFPRVPKYLTSKGRFPLHLAIWNSAPVPVVEALLRINPGAALKADIVLGEHARTNSTTALSVACFLGPRACAATVDMLLTACPELVTTRFAQWSDFFNDWKYGGDCIPGCDGTPKPQFGGNKPSCCGGLQMSSYPSPLPVMQALYSGAPAAVVLQLLRAAPETAAARGLLRAALEHGGDPAIVAAICAANPRAAGVASGRLATQGETALHEALRRGAPMATLVTLLAAHPAAAAVPFKGSGALPGIPLMQLLTTPPATVLRSITAAATATAAAAAAAATAPSGLAHALLPPEDARALIARLRAAADNLEGLHVLRAACTAVDSLRALEATLSAAAAVVARTARAAEAELNWRAAAAATRTGWGALAWEGAGGGAVASPPAPLGSSGGSSGSGVGGGNCGDAAAPGEGHAAPPPNASPATAATFATSGADGPPPADLMARVAERTAAAWLLEAAALEALASLDAVEAVREPGGPDSPFAAQRLQELREFVAAVEDRYPVMGAGTAPAGWQDCSSAAGRGEGAGAMAAAAVALAGGTAHGAEGALNEWYLPRAALFAHAALPPDTLVLGELEALGAALAACTSSSSGNSFSTEPLPSLSAALHLAAAAARGALAAIAVAAAPDSFAFASARRAALASVLLSARRELAAASAATRLAGEARALREARAAAFMRARKARLEAEEEYGEDMPADAAVRCGELEEAAAAAASALEAVGAEVQELASAGLAEAAAVAWGIRQDLFF